MEELDGGRSAYKNELTINTWRNKLTRMDLHCL
jgi:hypothetical protein